MMFIKISYLLEVCLRSRCFLSSGWLL